MTCSDAGVLPAMWIDLDKAQITDAGETVSTDIMHISGASQDDVEVFMRDMDVDIRIRNFMRSIPLPGVLRGAQMTSAVVEDDTLTIRFKVKEADG